MMKRDVQKLGMLALGFLIVSLVLISGCTGQGDQIITDVDHTVAYALIQDNEEDQNFVILDVRTPEEYAEGHIAEAMNLDYYSETFEDELDKLDKDKTYLIYCRTARRSRAALNIMEDLGFAEVYNLGGGIVEWEKLGFPTVK